MSHTRVKTTYDVQGNYGSTEQWVLFCDHSHTSDHVNFYDEDGSVTEMSFGEWSDGNDLWEAMNRLFYPFENNDWTSSNKKLKDGVEFYGVAPWEINK